MPAGTPSLLVDQILQIRGDTQEVEQKLAKALDGFTRDPALSKKPEKSLSLSLPFSGLG